MTIQLVRMKYSDETVIADVGEVFQNEEAKEKGERPLCLQFINPYTLHVVNETEDGYNVAFKKWNPFSDDKEYNVGFDLIGIISNVKPAVAVAYNEKVAVDTTPNEETTEDTERATVDFVPSGSS